MATTLALDRSARESRDQREAFAKVRNAESGFAAKLRSIAHHVGVLARGTGLATEAQVDLFAQLTRQYADLLAPWARAVAAGMLQDVSRRDERAWYRYGRDFGAGLAVAVRESPVGEVMRRLHDEQVALITSIPREAGERAQSLARELRVGGERSSELRNMLLRTEHVTRSRATLIARTETAKAASALTAARARGIGCSQYVWRTVRDRDVRPSHRKMEGRVCDYADPPEVEPGKRYHAGQFPNCFVGSTPVNLNRGVAGVLRARYSGDLILLTVRDSVISVTPNHPILTRRGWIPAKEIYPGDDVVQVFDQNRQISSQHDVEQKLITFDQLFEALSSSRYRKMGVFDLYGDEVIDNEVEVVSLKEDLALYTRADLVQAVRDDVVSVSDGGINRMGVVGSNHQVCEAFIASGLDILAIPYGTLPVGNELIGGNLVTDCYPSTLKYASYNDVGISVIMGESRRTLARIVAINHILDNIFRGNGYTGRSSRKDGLYLAASDVELAHDVADAGTFGGEFFNFLPIRNREIRRHFSGHVFTLQSYTGYYHVGAYGVTAKNCRCFQEPIIPDIYGPS